MTLITPYNPLRPLMTLYNPPYDPYDPFMTADCCPLLHLEAEQVIFLETVAVCPLFTERLSGSPGYDGPY